MTSTSTELPCRTKSSNNELSFGAYALKTTKMIRDMIHDYVYLSELELAIIDTLHFQRLRDIKQLTAQYVYPATQHTRFEHSLGVLGLTKMAIEGISKNGKLVDESDGIVIGDRLVVATHLAALLHDVGHYPFSHLGEKQVDIVKVREKLIGAMKTMDIDSPDLIEKINNHSSSHELLSCYIVLKRFDKLILYAFNLKDKKSRVHPLPSGRRESHSWRRCQQFMRTALSTRMLIAGRASPGPNLRKVDTLKGDASSEKSVKHKWVFEHIVRCIIGALHENRTDLCIKNILISTINSNFIDTDKLDYLMRDVHHSGINAAKIDTKRLFRNIGISQDNRLAFRSRALPVLENIIEARDSLYLWVINHHAAVYSDFLIHYIMRKLVRNTPLFPRELEDEFPEWAEAFRLCTIDKNQYFSVEAIDSHLISSSDVFVRLKKIASYALDSSSVFCHAEKGTYPWKTEGSSTPEEQRKFEEFARRACIAFRLCKQLYSRKYLKPLWKTLFEYTSFMRSHFPDDLVRKVIVARICGSVGGFACAAKDSEGYAEEFKSQLVMSINQSMNDYCSAKDGSAPTSNKSQDSESLFIVSRPNGFYSLEKISRAVVYFRRSGRLQQKFEDTGGDGPTGSENWYGKSLTNLLPHKDYAPDYTDSFFYIFVGEFDAAYHKKLEEVIVARMTEFAFRDSDIFNPARNPATLCPCLST